MLERREAQAEAATAANLALAERLFAFPTLSCARRLSVWSRIVLQETV